MIELHCKNSIAYALMKFNTGLVHGQKGKSSESAPLAFQRTPISDGLQKKPPGEVPLLRSNYRFFRFFSARQSKAIPLTVRTTVHPRIGPPVLGAVGMVTSSSGDSSVPSAAGVALGAA